MKFYPCKKGAGKGFSNDEAGDGGQQVFWKF